MPRVGSETKRNFGSSANALARQTFCWLPPESSLGLLLRAGALDLQLVNIAVGHGADGLFIAPFHKAAKQALEKLIVDLHGREGNVPLQRLVEQQAHAAAVLRHKGKLRVEAAAGAR